jgi:tripartite-type tricarboxylate transporter receptor subunit TctC
LATLVLAAGDFGRPYAMPPNTPAQHVKTIREAFAKTLNDEAVKADAAKKKLEIDPSTYDELEKLAKEVTSQSPDVVGKMKTLLAK